MIITVDLRVIFDDDEQLLIVGCHKCEVTTSAPIREIDHAAILTSKFAMEHIVACGTKRQ